MAKLGKRIKDPALVRFLQQIAQPSHIAAELQRIRKLLTAGKLIDAHMVLEELRFRSSIWKDIGSAVI